MSTMKGLEYTRHVFFTLEEKYICSVENILKSMRTILMENIDMSQPYLLIQFQKKLVPSDQNANDFFY